jgi:addiction module RelE/StbE family toxin
MDFIVQWTEKAQEDRERIYEYWNQRNGSNTYSSKLDQLLLKHIERIKLFPKVGYSTSRLDTRFVIIRNDYKLFYRSYFNHIIILRFWDVRQRPSKLKL